MVFRAKKNFDFTLLLDKISLHSPEIKCKAPYLFLQTEIFYQRCREICLFISLVFAGCKGYFTIISSKYLVFLKMKVYQLDKSRA
ncbi:MAG: hypothetical protein A2268_09080 [Candidatus Raymondbacteria bacterium RifOxyA12_full_50_37]|uniref:Uncharacterized protein n=1 Tax=Candidatus Raymondbacteria bacterium RIFOXYD12_FULL_49_13 TaxID=1817890 RepID=A0A1F7F0Q3_UNCRA|nr:MAG: hypothetical protein A2268_09080 [Candidatus Raymondbacteria bacterium RifOxyA12_full_50_37]OGJ86880.1 MAG: hypothetical protein A2248_08175 [Candidatus Raymondbacteria bacterium RIFOXYA2_FULL_49_16]OGJ94786.1 MAG: hypothetical protein A2350_20690 [Candidatus Raymondbacteria bacterium RifOxyB12_full_50_8]OGJ98035.1 MAG: hypothetical protein A2487_00855 [Candidatus Raymondbacteria bacterium RifOxyC12_full_50_8]OGK00229.1 MAG: hypothetical protein A2519_07085 [Candidatus Raymondbacteria b